MTRSLIKVQSVVEALSFLLLTRIKLVRKEECMLQQSTLGNIKDSVSRSEGRLNV